MQADKMAVGRDEKKNADDTKKGEEKKSGGAQSSRRYGRRIGDRSFEEPRVLIWMITFTDVMGLMLTFFVMMFAMSKPVQERWEDITLAVQNEFNRLYGAALQRGPMEDINLARINYDRALDINYLGALLEAIAAGNDFLKDARFIRQQGKLIVSLPQELLFQPGDAVIGEDGARSLYALGGILSRIKNKIQIVGHADPRPVEVAGGRGGKFASNWELSLARAAAVAGVLNGVGYGQNIDIVGNSSGRYHDLASIQDETERQDLARRVDIILLDHDDRKREPLFDLVSP